VRDISVCAKLFVAGVDARQVFTRDALCSELATAQTPPELRESEAQESSLYNECIRLVVCGRIFDFQSPVSEAATQAAL
jgi:hypothetical protein